MFNIIIIFNSEHLNILNFKEIRKLFFKNLRDLKDTIYYSLYIKNILYFIKKNLLNVNSLINFVINTFYK